MCSSLSTNICVICYLSIDKYENILFYSLEVVRLVLLSDRVGLGPSHQNFGPTLALLEPGQVDPRAKGPWFSP